MKINHKKLRYEYDNKSTYELKDRLRKFAAMPTRNEECQARYDVIKNTLDKRGEL